MQTSSNLDSLPRCIYGISFGALMILVFFAVIGFWQWKNINIHEKQLSSYHLPMILKINQIEIELHELELIYILHSDIKGLQFETSWQSLSAVYQSSLKDSVYVIIKLLDNIELLHNNYQQDSTLKMFFRMKHQINAFISKLSAHGQMPLSVDFFTQLKSTKIAATQLRRYHDRRAILLSNELKQTYQILLWKAAFIVILFCILWGGIVYFMFKLTREAILEQQQKENKLIQNENLLKTVLDTIPGHVYWKDTEGRLLGSNKSFAREIGVVSEADVYQKQWNESFLSKGLTFKHIDDRRVLESGIPILNKEEIITSNEKDWRIFETSTLPLSDSKGRLIGVLINSSDITKRKVQEEKFMERERLAFIGTIASGIAHEINNPLTLILYAAQLSLIELEGPNGRKEVSEHLQEIISTAIRGGDIVKSILQHAKDEPTDLSSCNIQVILHKSIESVKKLAEMKKASITLECSEHIPMLMLNPIEIEQLVFNLIQNAIQNGQEGVSVKVQVRLLVDDLEILIKDNGPGIDKEIQRHIFDPFYSSRKQGGDGMGLGLSIAKGILGRHKGDIHIESQPGKGATFIVTLPVNPSSKRRSNPNDKDSYY